MAPSGRYNKTHPRRILVNRTLRSREGPDADTSGLSNG
jgi:hypothetical protein